MAQGLRTAMAWSAHGSVRRWIQHGVASWTPTSVVAKAVYQAGFLYDPEQDIIYSRIDAWQHRFGYCYAYDAAALFSSFIFDCEPIFFRHGNKEWMIEFWKGQYGIETGCEAGIYNRSDDDNTPELLALDATIGRRKNKNGRIDGQHAKFYKCVDRNEYALIAFRLSRNGTELFSRGPEYHWWLTGFRWGVFSRPEELVMEVSVKFQDMAMQWAFVNSLRQLGYTNVDVSSCGVHFVFDTPRSYQPRRELAGLESSVVAADRLAVVAYHKLGLNSNDPNLIRGKAGEIISSQLQHARDFYVPQLHNFVKDADDEIAERVRDFFGLR
jgi:hypothetical protein